MSFLVPIGHLSASPTATSSHVYCTKIVTELLSQFHFFALNFTRPIYTVTAMRVVIV